MAPSTTRDALDFRDCGVAQARVRYFPYSLRDLTSSSTTNQCGAQYAMEMAEESPTRLFDGVVFAIIPGDDLGLGKADSVGARPRKKHYCVLTRLSLSTRSMPEAAASSHSQKSIKRYQTWTSSHTSSLPTSSSRSTTPPSNTECTSSSPVG